MLKHQRGVAALGIVLVMLTIMSLTMFYLNRGLLVEIKSTADHRRAAAAFEAAEAGLEWATALLDDPRLRNGLCEPDVGAGLSFRDRLLPLSIQPWTTPGPGAATAGSGAQPPTGISKAAIQELPSIAFVPRLDDRVGCRLDDDGLRCACPVAGQALTFEPAYGAHFTVSFAPVSGDGESVRVTSRGCIGDGSACAHAFMAASAASAALVASSASAAFASRPDALSCVQATLKLSPRMMQVPTAAITAGRDVRLGFTSLDNLASHGAGWLIHAGASIDAGAGAGASAGAGSSATSAIGAVLHSSGGTPIVASLASNDVRLAALGSKPMFKLLFGQSVEEFSADPGVKRIGPCAPVACGDQLSRLENEGWRVFSIDGDVLLPARSLGSMQNPALIVANGAVGFAGASTVYGLVMALGAWPGAGPARGRIVGAAVSGLDIDRPALSAVSYDGGVLARLRAAGPLLRVPGSWSDE